MGYMQPGTEGLLNERRYAASQAQKPESEPEQPKRMRGLGDLVHRMLQTVGIDRAVKKATRGRDCGCARRREALNRAVPFPEKPSDSETGGAT